MEIRLLFCFVFVNKYKFYIKSKLPTQAIALD